MISALFLLVLAIGAIAAGVGYVRKAAAMSRFRGVRGQVISREVVPTPGGTREGRFGDGGGFMAKVTYRYVVDGQEHVGDRMGYAFRGLRRSLAEQRLAAIPDEVHVWVNPEDPKDAYLERHTPTIGYFFLVGGGLAGLASVAWILGQV